MKFEKELSYIKNETVLKLVQEGISLIPEYFYSVPASSSGKYHPLYALGDGGLYRHVQVAVYFAKTLFTITKLGKIEEDLVIGSLILHDGWKQGIDRSGGNTLHEHPLIASQELRKNIFVGENSLQEYFLGLICENIESHMGQWTTSEYSDVVLPLPRTTMQRFVHMCDYLASRKPLEYNFSVQ